MPYVLSHNCITSPLQRLRCTSLPSQVCIISGSSKEVGERAFVLAVCLTVVVSSLTRQAGGTANGVFAFPDTRRWVAQQLQNQPGKQLVLVSYDMQRHYPGNELVHNGADFNSEKILWARSKGADSDRDLCTAYSDRTFWSVQTDDVNVSLNPLDLCKHP